MKKYIKKTLSAILAAIILAGGMSFTTLPTVPYSLEVNAIENTDNTDKELKESEIAAISSINTEIIKPEKITLSNTDIALNKGESVALTADVFPKNTTDKNIIWTSSDKSVVSVTDGILTAISGGAADIIAASSNGITAVCRVTVTVPTENITLSKTSLDIQKGKTATITAKISPLDSSNKAVTWTSSDESVAVVSDGVIMAVSGGTAVITASSANGLSATCKVNVTVPAESIVITQNYMTLEKGESFTLTAQVLPHDTTDKTVIWSSSDSNIVSVVGGKITANAPGTATITAKTINGKSVKYTVKVIILPTSIMLDRNSITLEKGKTQTISTTILPTNATEKNITWSSTNKNIVTVSDSKITAVGPGTASINVSTVNGKNTKCTVKVIVKPTSVKINKTSLTLERGESYTLGATLYPNDTTEKNLTWTSSDTNILSVSNGKVTAKAAGKATVTVKTSNGKTAKCTVNVVISPTGIKLNKTSATIEKGKTYTVKATLSPSNATNKTVSWTSSDTKIATVKDGVITAKGVGSATITAKISNGKSATFKANVIISPTSVKLNKTSLTLGVGKTETLKATVSPSNSTSKTVSWSTSNSKVATVSNGKITAKGVGTANITAKTSNGKSSTCKVTVKNLPTKISLNKTSTIVKAGYSTTLRATVSPNSNVINTVTWTSSDNNTATVQNGKITAKKAGDVVITAKTVNGKTATCKVRVYVVNYKNAYTADQVYSDINYLQKSYPDIIKVSSIGKSVKNRDIKLIQLGKGNKKALIVGGIHAREHITVSYIMRCIEEYAYSYKNNYTYGGYKIRDLLNKYTLYFIPMSNPDGTQIANSSEKPLYVPKSFNNDSFKGNANAVNLNRNFPFHWYGATDGTNRNQTNYRGPSAGSEPETKAIMNLCNKNNFQFMLSMHILGGGIYWKDSANGTVTNDYKLATSLSNKCKYLLFENTTIESEYAGGLENWFRYAYNKPGFCIEMIPFNQYYLSDTYAGYNENFDKALDWTNTKYTFAEAMKVM